MLIARRVVLHGGERERAPGPRSLLGRKRDPMYFMTVENVHLIVNRGLVRPRGKFIYLSLAGLPPSAEHSSCLEGNRYPHMRHLGPHHF